MPDKISSTYTFAFLVKHPASKEIVLKHLAPLGIDEAHLSRVDGTLSSLLENMGGGIPYHILVALMEELDQLCVQDLETTLKDDDHANSF